MIVVCKQCQKEIKVKPSYKEETKNICCSKRCMYLFRSKVYLGKNNPNKKYKFDISMFKNVDNETKAYFLGWIASDGNINNSTVRISIHKKDIVILQQIKDKLNIDVPLKFYKTNMVDLVLNSKELVNDICKLLDINPGKKSHTVGFPALDKQYQLAFIRGYFDGDGTIRDIAHSKAGSLSRPPDCSIVSNSQRMLKSIIDICPGGNVVKDCLSYCGNNCLDFLGKIYYNATIALPRKYDLYLSISTWVPAVSYSKYFNTPHFKFNKTNHAAVSPFKKNISDSGYDLTLISLKEKIKFVDKNVYIYDTGIKIQPNFGYYFDVVARSSLYKQGYMLANGFGVIDRTYIGPILIPLVKIDEKVKDLSLPGRYVQIIPRHIVHFELEEVEELSTTDRGESGFGSTGR